MEITEKGFYWAKWINKYYPKADPVWTILEFTGHRWFEFGTEMYAGIDSYEIDPIKIERKIN